MLSGSAKEFEEFARDCVRLAAEPLGRAVARCAARGVGDH